MAIRRQDQENKQRQSLMAVLNKFVEAVDSMDDKVMIPSRLRDMDMSQTQDVKTSEENNNMSLLPFSQCHGEELYNYYVMINTIKREVLCGNSSSYGQDTTGSSGCGSDNCGDDSDDSLSDTPRKTAEAFRHHLQGLFGLLNQLTDTAKYLGDAYETQVGGARKVKTFTL